MLSAGLLWIEFLSFHDLLSYNTYFQCGAFYWIADDTPLVLHPTSNRSGTVRKEGANIAWG